MESQFFIDIFRQGIMVALSMMAVIVLPGLLVGLLVAFFQAATQINEMSLTFVPKIFVTFVSLMIFGPFLLTTITEFTTTLYRSMPHIIG